MQEIEDFGISKEEKQNFINKLFELNQMDLIEAIFLVSTSRETCGVPYDVIGIKISSKGREFMSENYKSKGSVVQNINISSTSGILNIAGKDINITNGADADKFVEKLLENIELSNLSSEKKKYISTSIKDMVVSVSSSVLAGLITASIGG